MMVAYLPTFAFISLCEFLVNRRVEKQTSDLVSLQKILDCNFLPELLEYPHLFTQADFYGPCGCMHGVPTFSSKGSLTQF